MYLYDWGFSAVLGATFLTSILSGMTGMAGGVILIALMVSWMEAAYVIPLHGAIQAVSGMSRTALFFRHLRWRIILHYTLGVVPGALLGVRIVSFLPGDVFKLLMGCFILLVTWLPKLRPTKGGGSERYFVLLGFFSGALSAVVGVSGVLIAPYFIRDDISKLELIATKSTCQGLAHVVKVPAYGLVGANVFVHWQQVVALGAAAFFGIMVGKRMLHLIPDKAFFFGFKMLLTVISLRLIIKQGLALWG